MQQEQAAAKLLAAVKGGQSLDDAATVAGVTVRRTAARHARRQRPKECRRSLRRPLFSLKPGEPTMVESARRASSSPCRPRSSRPTRRRDPAGYAQVREAVAALERQTISPPYSPTRCASARSRKINQPVVDTVTGQ